MSPLLQIIIGSILIVIGAFGTIMFKNGIEKLKHPTENQPPKSIPEIPIRSEDQSLKKENQQKVIKIKLNRIIEDANLWLQEKIEENHKETDKLANNFNRRNVYYSGMHVSAQIERVNNFIKSVNIYVTDVNRKIEDLVLSVGEDKFEGIEWLKDQNIKYQEFIKRIESAKDSAKTSNNNLCLRVTDKPTFESIQKSKPYIN